jgi:predicted nucleic acid-binding protein
MSGIVFDASVYVHSIRQGDMSIFTVRRASLKGKQKTFPVWLSSVVLEELYVGAQNNSMKKRLAQIRTNFDKSKNMAMNKLGERV